MDEYQESTYGDSMADVYDEIQGDRNVQSTVNFLLPYTSSRALELGIGTGRVAIPLAEQGVVVIGIDNSRAMLEQLKRKPGANKVSTILADMADVPVDGSFSLIFAVFGTFFCIGSQEGQVHCFQKVAKHLTEAGVFVLECSMPDFSAFTRNQNVRVGNMSIDRLTITATEHDPVTQRTTTQHLLATPNGIRLMPVCVRYSYPSELDLMAKIAGLELKERYGDWHRNPFTANSIRHISVYGKP